MKTTAIVLLTLLIGTGQASARKADSGRTAHYNLSKTGLALKGYDPVSYHKGQARKGSESIMASHDGILFHFASKANREAFRNDAERYLPAYGGWCAWAMLEGDKVDINPHRYKIINGKTYLFYDGFFGNTLKKWNKKAEKTSEADLIQIANTHWYKYIDQERYKKM
jgi:YHS domain-containing protein